MAKIKHTKVVPYRRKLNGRTNYRKRLKLLMGHQLRLVIRKTNKNMVVQIVKYNPDGDHVIVSVNSSQLKKFGWEHATGNLPAAYLTGVLAGKLAIDKKIKNAIVDLGLQTPMKGSRLYASVKGAIDAGLDVPASEEIFPPQDRLTGKHIEAFGKTSKQFKKSPEGMEKAVADVKARIMKK